MNPLTHALKLADDPQPGSVARAADRLSPPALPEDAPLGPIRATRDDPVPDDLSLPALPVGDAPGLETPMRATGHGPGPATGLPATPAVYDASGPEVPSGARLAPIQATRTGAIAGGASPGDGFAAPEPPASARTTLAGTTASVLSDSAGVPAADAEATPTAARRDYRSLHRGRGIGRFVGIALSLLAVAGTAVGGTFLWKAEFARPLLVRHLPPVAVADLVPMRAANATGGPNRAPATVAASRSEGPAVRSPAVPKKEEHAGDPAPAPASAARQNHASEAPRSEGAPNSTTVAPQSERHPIVSTDAARSTGLAAGATAISAAQAPDPASTAVRAPRSPADLRVAAAVGRSTPEPDQDDAEPPSGSGPRVVIRKRMRADHVAAPLDRAYAAYLAGDAEAAGEAYRTVLGHEPRNRDARLGLAAVAARAGRWAEAADHYAALLASHPADTAARAALIAIGEKDPARAESRLKALLRIEPEAAHLHFSLGNLYASQSRWPEAQRSWFNAYRLDRGNADHAYNLAVSLDHLSQSRNALDLYREALVLARSGPASFVAEGVRRRIRDLESRPDAERTAEHATPEAPAAAVAPVR